MRNFLLSLFCLFASSSSLAQTTAVNYSYDAAGNRISRTPATIRTANMGGQKDTSISWGYPLANITARTAAYSDSSIAHSDWTDSIPELARQYRTSGYYKRLSLVPSEREKAIMRELFHQQQDSTENAYRIASLTGRDYNRWRSTGDTTYSVGAIQLEEGVSPCGARTYNIPIPTANGFKLTPSVSLGYSSQGVDISFSLFYSVCG